MPGPGYYQEDPVRKVGVSSRYTMGAKSNKERKYTSEKVERKNFG